MAFQKAQKYGARLRMAIAGPAGAGKTWTALALATTLADGKPIAVIDTEHGSASKYADVFSFDVQELSTFHPKHYIEAIHEAEQAGYAVLVIDSLSHAWTGQGGVLEEKDRIAKAKYSGNTFSAWSDAGALQNSLVNTILSAKIHVICTVRSKMEHVLEKNEQTGKSTPRKVGLSPVQRDDLPYEFDVFATMDVDNTMIIDKSRCSELAGAVIQKPDASVAEVLKAWLDGAPMPIRKASRDRLNEIYALGKRASLYANAAEFTVYAQMVLGLDILPSVNDLSEDQARDVETAIQQRMAQASKAS